MLNFGKIFIRVSSYISQNGKQFVPVTGLFGNSHMKGMKSRKSQYIVLIDTNDIRAGFSGSFLCLF